jgi:hypothetical protein
MRKGAFSIRRCPYFFLTLLLLAPAASASWASIMQASSDTSLGLAFAGAHLGGATPSGLLKKFVASPHTSPVLAGSFFGSSSLSKHQVGTLIQPRIAASWLSPARGRSFAGTLTASLKVKQEKAERTTGHKVVTFPPHVRASCHYPWAKMTECIKLGFLIVHLATLGGYINRMISVLKTCESSPTPYIHTWAGPGTQFVLRAALRDLCEQVRISRIPKLQLLFCTTMRCNSYMICADDDAKVFFCPQGSFASLDEQSSPGGCSQQNVDFMQRHRGTRVIQYACFTCRKATSAIKKILK